MADFESIEIGEPFDSPEQEIDVRALFDLVSKHANVIGTLTDILCGNNRAHIEYVSNSKLSDIEAFGEVVCLYENTIANDPKIIGDDKFKAFVNELNGSMSRRESQ